MQLPKFLLRPLLILVLTLPARAQSIHFELSYEAGASPAPVTGRVYVFLSPDTTSRPAFRRDPFKPAPFVARDVVNWKAGEKIVINNFSLAFPAGITGVPPGRYAIQAFLDVDTEERDFLKGAGNRYSSVLVRELGNIPAAAIPLSLDQQVKPVAFHETDSLKELNFRSNLLSRFYGREVRVKAAVLLPPSYHRTPAMHYPTVYVIPGFGATHSNGNLNWSLKGLVRYDGLEKVYVVLNPECALGHHAFADSENNGPRSRSLLEEVIPLMEASYRVIKDPGARFLTGHSSGGWSSLWLQITYPDQFAGAWALAPDPVDFRSFHEIDIYQSGANVFRNAANEPRRLERVTGQPGYQSLSDKERVIGDGENLGSFEAVFGPRGRNGKPVPLWNRTTGTVDPQVARHWSRYDIRRVLESRRATLLPKLAGKLHVYVGDKDHFYFEAPVNLLRSSLREMGSDAVIEVYPGLDHLSIRRPEIAGRIDAEINHAFEKRFPEWKAGFAGQASAQKREGK